MNTKLTKKELLDNPQIAMLARSMEIEKDLKLERGAPYGFKDRTSKLVVTRITGTTDYQDQSEKPLSSASYKLEYLLRAPEFWTPIIEFDLKKAEERVLAEVKKDFIFELLSFKLTDLATSKGIFVRGTHGMFECPRYTGCYSLEQMFNHGCDNLNNGHLAIHSVKRLSDGEVFTIGDKINMACHSSPKGTITSFQISGIAKSGLYIQYTSSDYITDGDLSQASKAKVPLFVTEDGVEKFKGDASYLVWPDSVSLACKTPFHYDVKPNHNGLLFHTKEAAEEYILMNKPCLSIEDLYKIRIGGVGSPRFRMKLRVATLKELVKSRLKLN